MLALPLFATNQSLRLPMWLRWLMRLAVIPLALASLSPVWTPAILVAPEFRLQTLLAATAVGLAVIAPLFKRLPLRILIILLVVGDLAALTLPLLQFSLIQAGVGEAYHHPISLGWGWWLTVGGIVISVVGGVWTTIVSR
jgi:hypothetical protein